VRGPLRLLIALPLAAVLLVPALNAPAGDRRERAVIRLMNKAIGAVERERACRSPRPPLDRRPSLTGDPPTTELLDTLAVLRRPQTDEERLAVNTIRVLAAEGIHRNHVRVARSAAGRAFLIVPARDVSFYEPRPRRCVAELRRRFRGLIDDRPRRFRRRARRQLERIIRTEWTAPSEGEVEGVFMLDFVGAGGAGGGIGGMSAAFIREQGMFGSSSGTGRTSRVDGLLPDGVATLEATFSRVGARRPDGPPKRYARPVTRAVPVQDNVVSFSVPRAPLDAFPSRQIWRGPDGSVIREISSGGGGPPAASELLRLTK
jgi:hypothetical protein